MRWKKFVIILLTIITLVVMGGVYIGFFYNTSEGSRVGSLAKLSHRGKVIKTWEGQLITGGMAGNNNSDFRMPYWEFSVYPGDDETRRALTKAMDEGYRIKVSYEQKLFTIRFRGDTDYFVTGVERVKNEE
ncbi:MAG: hypothetical protein AB8F95_11405 [Bacteroidia bacterium]